MRGARAEVPAPSPRGEDIEHEMGEVERRICAISYFCCPPGFVMETLQHMGRAVPVAFGISFDSTHGGQKKTCII